MLLLVVLSIVIHADDEFYNPFIVHSSEILAPSAQRAIMSESDEGFRRAVEEATKGASEGGVPIGACLVSKDGRLLGQGHNMRVQKGSATLHVGLPASLCDQVRSLTPRRPRFRLSKTLGGCLLLHTLVPQCILLSRHATCVQERAYCTRYREWSLVRTRRSWEEKDT